jgi:hypothetical protein
MIRWRRDPRVLWRRSGPRVLFLAPSSGELGVLEGVGAVVWELLETPMYQADLLQTLADAFGLPLSDVEDQLRPFLVDLHGQGALIENDGARRDRSPDPW